MKPQEVKKQMFFPFMGNDGKIRGIIINKLEDGSYLFERQGLFYPFIYQQLKESSRNDRFVILPFIVGNTELGSPYAIKHDTFKKFLEDFARYFDELYPGGFHPVI